MNPGDIFNLLFLSPVVNLLVLILRALDGMHIPGALGFSIIILTIIIRFLIWPLLSSQMRSSKKMADLRPQLQELNKKHAGDKKALGVAQMALYKEHGVNPAGGCLPVLIQIPIILALYQTILSLFDGANGIEKINYFLYSSAWRLTHSPDLNFLGFNLALKPSKFTSSGWHLLIIPVLTGLTQFIQAQMMQPKQIKVYQSDSPKEKKEKEGQEDTMQAMQSQMSFMMPLMFVYLSFSSFPIGISLYWNALNIVSIYQQYKISGWGNVLTWLDKLNLKRS